MDFGDIIFAILYGLKEFIPPLDRPKSKWIKPKKTIVQKIKDFIQKLTERPAAISDYRYIEATCYPSFIRKDYSLCHEGESMFDVQHRTAVSFFSLPDLPPGYDPSSEERPIRKKNDKPEEKVEETFDRSQVKDRWNSQSMSIQETEGNNERGSKNAISSPIDIPGAYPTLRMNGQRYRMVKQPTDEELFQR